MPSMTLGKSPGPKRGWRTSSAPPAPTSLPGVRSTTFEDAVKQSILLSHTRAADDSSEPGTTASQQGGTTASQGGTMGSITRVASTDSQAINTDAMELMDERQKGALKARMLAKREAERVRNQTKAFDMIKEGKLGSMKDLEIHKGAAEYRGKARVSGRPAGEREGGSYDGEDELCQIDPGNPDMKLPFGIVHPYSSRRLLWDVVMFMLLVYSTISIPVFLAFFDDETCSPYFLDQMFWFYVDFSVDVLFIIDMGVSFRTAVIRRQHGDMWIVTRPLHIAKRYIRSGFFFIDLVASFPFELVIMQYCVADAAQNDTVGTSSVISRGSRILKLFKIIRILRLLRVAKLHQFMSKLRDVLQLHPGIVRLSTFLIIITLVGHYCACAFFYVGEAWLVPGGTLAEETISWTTQTFFVQERNETHPSKVVSVHDMDSKFAQYAICMYWATMTMTTTGYGDVIPQTIPEISFATIVIIIGGITYSFIIGNLAILLLRVMGGRYKSHMAVMEELEEFVHRENMPLDLGMKIRLHKRQQYLMPSRLIPDFAAQSMSSSLLKDFTMHIYRNTLSKLPLLSGLSESCLTAMALKLETRTLSPGEIMYLEGQAGHHLFFLCEGSVELSMCMLTEKMKQEYGARPIQDPAVRDWFTTGIDKKGRNTVVTDQQDGTVHWIGDNCHRYKFYKWTLNPKNTAVFGESVFTSVGQKRLSTAVTASWCRILTLSRASIQDLESQFPSLKLLMKRLNFASKRRPTIRKIASKILRVMRMSQQVAGSLSIQVRACTNLPVAAGEHRVDAFVMIQVVDRYGKIDRAHSKRKTLTVFNTCNPEFEEVFVYDFKTANDLDGFLKCTVVDYNASKTSTDIGFATIPLSTWIKEGIVNDKVLAKTEWHKLQRPEKAGKTGYLKSKTTGKGSKILISVSTTSSGVEDNEVAMAKAKLNSAGVIEIGTKDQAKLTGMVKGKLAGGEKRDRTSSLPVNKYQTIMDATKGFSHDGDIPEEGDHESESRGGKSPHGDAKSPHHHSLAASNEEGHMVSGVGRTLHVWNPHIASPDGSAQSLRGSMRPGKIQTNFPSTPGKQSDAGAATPLATPSSAATPSSPLGPLGRLSRFAHIEVEREDESILALETRVEQLSRLILALTDRADAHGIEPFREGAHLREGGGGGQRGGGGSLSLSIPPDLAPRLMEILQAEGGDLASILGRQLEESLSQRQGRSGEESLSQRQGRRGEGAEASTDRCALIEEEESTESTAGRGITSMLHESPAHRSPHTPPVHLPGSATSAIEHSTSSPASRLVPLPLPRPIIGDQSGTASPPRAQNRHALVPLPLPLGSAASAATNDKDEKNDNAGPV